MIGNNKTNSRILSIYREEKKFISDLFNGLPESAQLKLASQSVSGEDAYIIESDEEGVKNKSKKAKFELVQNQVKSSRTGNVEELKDRLHKKIAELGMFIIMITIIVNESCRIVYTLSNTLKV